MIYWVVQFVMNKVLYLVAFLAVVTVLGVLRDCQKSSKTLPEYLALHVPQHAEEEEETPGQRMSVFPMARRAPPSDTSSVSPIPIPEEEVEGLSDTVSSEKAPSVPSENTVDQQQEASESGEDALYAEQVKLLHQVYQEERVENVFTTLMQLILGSGHLFSPSAVESLILGELERNAFRRFECDLLFGALRLLHPNTSTPMAADLVSSASPLSHTDFGHSLLPSDADLRSEFLTDTASILDSIATPGSPIYSRIAALLDP